MPIIKTLKKEKDFVQIDNALARNTELTYEAKGLLLELLSRPTNWKVHKNQLARSHTKESKITRIMKELQTHRYGRIIQVRDKNNRRIKDRVWIISESPKTEEEWIKIEEEWIENEDTLENLNLRESQLRELRSNTIKEANTEGKGLDSLKRDFLNLRESRSNNIIKNINTNKEYTSNTKVLKGSLKNSSTTKKDNKKVFAQDSIPYILASYQLDSVLEILPNFRGKNWEKDKKYREHTLQNWAAVHDKIIRLDKRNTDEVMDIIDFVAKDSFWSANVLSAGKLRDQYDKLFLQMNNRKSMPIESHKDDLILLKDENQKLTYEIITKYCQLIGTNFEKYELTVTRHNKFILTSQKMVAFFSRGNGRIPKNTWVDYLMECMQEEYRTLMCKRDLGHINAPAP